MPHQSGVTSRKLIVNLELASGMSAHAGFILLLTAKQRLCTHFAQSMKNTILLVCGMQLWRHLPLSVVKVPTPPILRQPFCQPMGHNIGTIYLALLLRPFRMLWKTAISSNQPAESSCGIKPRLAVASLFQGPTHGSAKFSQDQFSNCSPSGPTAVS